MQRREFHKAIIAGIGVTAAAGIKAEQPPPRLAAASSTYTFEDIRRKLGDQVPAKLAAVLCKTLNENPKSFDTDWNGTFRIEGLLRWSRRGLPEGLTFARAWFDHHLQHDPKISDEKFLKAHDSAGSRVIRTGVLPHTTYIGFYGLAFACFELYRQTEDPKARQVCLDIADTILHLAPRDKNGLVAHDHVRFTEFAIPDTAYFVVRALMIAASLESDIGGVFRRQAIHQARLHSEIFLDRKLGLVKTVRLPSGLGETYWCRASGWLLWTLTAALHDLPKTDEAYAPLVHDLETLAAGVASGAGPTGGLRVLINEENTPEETSGTAMCVAGIHEAMRRGWLRHDYTDFVKRGWRFVLNQIGPEGRVRNIHTGWALPAEERRITFDHKYHGWIPGMIMTTADEMLG